jgi:NAD(P)-dependent dehydrogenase (short-subunit alcohol dehydrogenase family)
VYQADKLSGNPDSSSSETDNTGGSAGIGRAVALGLSDNGAVVTVLARRKDRLDAVVEQLHEVNLHSHSQLFLGSVCMTRLVCGHTHAASFSSASVHGRLWRLLVSARHAACCAQHNPCDPHLTETESAAGRAVGC